MEPSEPSETNSDGLRQRKKDSEAPTAPEASAPLEASAAPQTAPVKKSGWNEASVRKLVTRLWYGSLLFFFFLFIVYLGHLPLIGFIIVVQCLLFRELAKVRYKEEKAKEVPLFRTLIWCWFSVAMFYSHGDLLYHFSWLEWVEHYHVWMSFGLYVLCFVVSVLSFKENLYKYQIGQLAWTLLSVGLVVGQTKYITKSIFAGLYWFLFPAFLIISNDSNAYFTGLLCGKKFIKRPLLSLSPNKTWEGFIGGALCTMIFAFIAPYFLMHPWLICPLEEPFARSLSCTPNPVFQPRLYKVPPVLNLIIGEHFTFYPIQFHSVVLSVFASVVAPFGGFFASAVKRAYAIKDFDSIIPGHGGIMDRMDCQLLMALCTGVHYQTFVQQPAAAILRQLAQLSDSDKQTVLNALTRYQSCTTTSGSTGCTLSLHPAS